MTELEKQVAERVEAELSRVDIEERFGDMLNESYRFDCVGGPFVGMEPSKVLEEMDPTAFRCGANDWADGEIKDGQLEYLLDDYYWADEVQKIRDEVEEELDNAEAEKDG